VGGIPRREDGPGGAPDPAVADPGLGVSLASAGAAALVWVLPLRSQAFLCPEIFFFFFEVLEYKI
jgi:hypothetical protein